MAWEQCNGCPYNGKYKCAPPQDPTVPCPQREEIAQQEFEREHIAIEPLDDNAFTLSPGEVYGPFVCSVAEAIGGPVVEYWTIDPSDYRYAGRTGTSKQVLAFAWAQAQGRAKRKWGQGYWRLQIREIGSGHLIGTISFGRKES